MSLRVAIHFVCFWALFVYFNWINQGVYRGETVRPLDSYFCQKSNYELWATFKLSFFSFTFPIFSDSYYYTLYRQMVITLQTFTIFQTLLSVNKVKIQNDCMSDNHCHFNEFIKSQTTLYHIMIYSVRRFNERVTNEISFWCFKSQIFKRVHTF